MGSLAENLSDGRGIGEYGHRDVSGLDPIDRTIAIGPVLQNLVHPRRAKLMRVANER